MAELRYGNGRVVVLDDIDPSAFTPAERAAHARIYAETGSPIAAWMAGITTTTQEDDTCDTHTS